MIFYIYYNIYIYIISSIIYMHEDMYRYMHRHMYNKFSFTFLSFHVAKILRCSISAVADFYKASHFVGKLKGTILQMYRYNC